MTFAMAILGAFAGWLIAGLETYGFVIGGIFGAVAGVILRRALRHEIAAATAGLRAEIERLSASPAPTADRASALAPSPPAVAASPSIAVERPAVATVPRSAARAPARVLDDAGASRPAAVAATTGYPDAPVAAPDSGADIAQRIVGAARNWLFGGNTIVRIGLVILFVGLSFLASYAASAGLFPIELRLALIAVAGIALLVFGFRTRLRRPEYGLALQGGGIAAIYLTLFAAARLFDVVPALAAFVLMIAVCALGCALALLQRSQAMAVTSFAGGFAVPLLLGTGGGAIAGVFAYYTVLNAAILVIAQRQAWRGLDLVGFFATFGVTGAWMLASYRPDDYAVTQAFVIVSVLIYLATALLYTRATPGRLGNVVDTTLLFGPALAGFGLQVGLVGDRPFGAAFAALGFAAVYLGVAAFAQRRARAGLRVMNEAMLAIGIGFVTIAVPLALGATWTSAVWAVEGAGAFRVGMRQARWMPRLFGLALQAIAALLFLAGIGPNVWALPIVNPNFVGAMLIAAAAIATAWWLRRPLPHSGSWFAGRYAPLEAALAAPAFLFGFAFWCGAWVLETTRMAPPAEAGAPLVRAFAVALQPLLAMLAFVLSAWAAQAIAARTGWRVARWPSRASLAALVLGFVGQLGAGGHVLDTPGWAVWIVAVAVHLYMLRRNDAAEDGSAATVPPLSGAIHVGGVWLATALLADMLWVGVDRGGLWDTSWAGVVFLVSVVAVLGVLTFWAGRAIRGGAAASRWPLDRHAAAYAWVAAAPIALLAIVAAVATALFASGRTDPLPYVPLLNPVDLSLALTLAVLVAWRRAIVAASPAPPGSQIVREPAALAALAGLAFVMVNTVWLRAAHRLLGVAWTPGGLLDSVVVQSGIAILWTLLALALMVLAHRRTARALWLVGAGLLGLTAVKLLLVDLNAAGGGARIIAFIVVGILMLVVGYAAPLPPRAADADDRSVAA